MPKPPEARYRLHRKHSPVLLALAACQGLARGGDGVDLRPVLTHRQPQLQRLGAVRGQPYGGAHRIVQRLQQAGQVLKHDVSDDVRGFKSLQTRLGPETCQW